MTVFNRCLFLILRKLKQLSMGLVYIIVQKVGTISFVVLLRSASSVGEGGGDLCHKCSEAFLRIKKCDFQHFFD